MSNVDRLRDFILHPVPPCPPDWQATPGVRGAITGDLNRALRQPGGSTEQANARRRILLAFLFAPERTALSSGDLTREQWYALYRWIGYWHDPVDGWQKRPEFPTEAGILLIQALKTDQEKMAQLLHVQEMVERAPRQRL